MMTEQEITQAAQAYRDYREKCGYQDPVALNEIECAYYQGMLEMLKHMTGKTEERKHEEAFETSYENTRSTIDALSHKFIEREDERVKNEIIAFVVQSIHRGGGTPIPEEKETKWIAWLEKQGKQKPLSEQKPAWSEEDEKKIMWLVRLISTAGFRELDTDKMLCSRSEFLNWLKSLKERMKGETTGISGANISQVCNNKRKTAGGYIWRYEVQN